MLVRLWGRALLFLCLSSIVLSRYFSGLRVWMMVSSSLGHKSLDAVQLGDYYYIQSVCVPPITPTSCDLLSLCSTPHSMVHTVPFTVPYIRWESSYHKSDQGGFYHVERTEKHLEKGRNSGIDIQDIDQEWW
jgi:hypothetical protein